MAKLMFFTFPIHIGKTVLDLKKKKSTDFNVSVCSETFGVSEEKYHESVTFFILKLYTCQVWDGKGWEEGGRREKKVRTYLPSMEYR